MSNKRKQNSAQIVSHPYPLFDELVKLIETSGDANIDINILSKTVAEISNILPEEEAFKHYWEIAQLILHYELVNNKNTNIISQKIPVPYDGKLLPAGKGIIYYIYNLPPGAQQIIAKYIETQAE